ncbi:MAG: DUF1249 domain-containing protein [Pseudomonadota bacterium]|nr:DUF1249 domain-containing protein [Pseudomonadota bacterium]
MAIQDNIDVLSLIKKRFKLGNHRKKQRFGSYVPDLVADLAQCDANYYRLLRIFPEIDECDAKKIGFEADRYEKATVDFLVTERCPFTITLDLRIEIFPEHRIIKWPNLQFRIYKDTKSAEVISFEQHRKFEYRYPLFNENLFQPDEKSQANRYLGELLEHFMKRGYSLNHLEFS